MKILLYNSFYLTVFILYTGNLTYSWSSTGTAFVNDTQLDTPQSIYINSGTIYISDAADTPIIRSISVSGTTVSTFISSTSLANPQAIYIDQSNDVYIPDYDNACVYKFTTTGSLVTPTSVAAGDDGNPGSELNQLNGPMHIAFDAAETYMFVADSNNNRIIRFSTTASPNSDGVVVAVSYLIFIHLLFLLEIIKNFKNIIKSSF